MQTDDRYLRAGWVYLILGVLILAITVFSPGLASEERRTDLIHLLVGLPFFVLFAAFIARGDRWLAAILRICRLERARAARIGELAREKLVMVLSLSALGRTLVFLSNGFGWQPRVRFSPFLFELLEREPAPRMLLNAVLMALIFIFLVQASWIPFLKRRQSSR